MDLGQNRLGGAAAHLSAALAVVTSLDLAANHITAAGALPLLAARPSSKLAALGLAEHRIEAGAASQSAKEAREIHLRVAIRMQLAIRDLILFCFS